MPNLLDIRRRIKSVKNTQQITTASAQGDLFSLPAGPVSAAIGVEYRKRTLLEESNPVALGQINAVGVRGMPTAICPTAATCRYGRFIFGNCENLEGRRQL